MKDKYTCPRRCGCDPMKGPRHGKGHIYFAFGEVFTHLAGLLESGRCGCTNVTTLSQRMNNRECLSVTTDQLKREQVESLKGEVPRWGWRSWGPEIDPKLYEAVLRMPVYSQVNVPQDRFTRLDAAV